MQNNFEAKRRELELTVLVRGSDGRCTESNVNGEVNGRLLAD